MTDLKTDTQGQPQVGSDDLLAAAERLEGLAERWEETGVWHEPPATRGDETFFQPSKHYALAEEAECVLKCLDDREVPKMQNGETLSLWGRVVLYATLSERAVHGSNVAGLAQMPGQDVENTLNNQSK